MASISSWLWGTSQLDEAVDKATSELIPNGSEDVALNLEICDQIRSKSTPAKDAMRALKRRLNHKNPNVQRLALGLTDICVKNGGDHFLAEMSSREFMDNLVSILKMPGVNHFVKNDILKYIQNWSLAFEGKPNFSYVGQVHKTLRVEGYHFPPVDFALANSAMVDTSTAPEWIDSDVCLRCRTLFTFTNRKHHCRNCGQVFDQQCSSKSIPLPHFGITQAVRVCDGCYNKLQKKAEYSNKETRDSARYTHRGARDFVDPDLQRAIQSSLEEIGTARKPGYVPAQHSAHKWKAFEPPHIDRKTHPDRNIPIVDDDDPDLRAAIEASLREASAPKPSAPVELSSTEPSKNVYATSQPYPPAVTPVASVPKLASYDLEPLEADAILTFGQTMEQMEAQGVRDMSRHPAVNDLFDKANVLRPKLAMSLDDTDNKAQALSELNDKLSQAVKLYDKLLTEQVTRPAWLRSPQQTHFATVPLQQSTQTPASRYGQRAPSHQPASSTPSPVFAPPRTDSAQYAQPVVSRHSLSVPGPSRHPTAPLASPPALPPGQQTSQSTLPRLSQPTTASATYMVHQPVSIPEFATAPPASQPVLTSASPPVVQPFIRQTPELTQQQTVAAHATMTPPSAPLTHSSALSRTSHTQYLSQFPSAPTTVPKSFELFAPSPPTTIPERREDLLIEL